MRKRLLKDADHPDIADSLNNLGEDYQGLGDDLKANDFYLQAFEMRKRLFKDADHPDIADSLIILSASYSRLGDDLKEKDFYLQAFEMRKRLFKDKFENVKKKSL
ncbi:unnamed protein product [Brachionus calyciflorus]|uniref:Tetratricopeptide repeat protein n=1 Tax=Brachionus calyciflorus TaxID=104777 RepID=A0A814RE01_9BILA|nr:unnamed protein product [Brachionus calyciflorus]